LGKEGDGVLSLFFGGFAEAEGGKQEGGKRRRVVKVVDLKWVG